MTSPRIIAWTMWIFASIFYAYQYILRVLPNIMMPEIMQKFQIDAGTFGQFSGLYYLGYAGLHLPIGLLLDRWGPKRVMPICALLMVSGLLPLVYTDLWIYPCVGRILIGIGSSSAILGIFKIIRLGFPEEKFSQMLGISVTIGLLGAIYGGLPVHQLLALFGWKQVMLIIALCGIGLAAILFLIIPSVPTDQKTFSVLSSLKKLFTNPPVIITCLLGGLMVGPLEGFADAWGTEFLKSVYALSSETAAGLPSLIYFGMCVGCLGLTGFADRTRSHDQVTIFSALIMGISFIFLLQGNIGITALSILLFIVGIFCAYQIIVIYRASTFVTEQSVGVTTAFANMVIMTFGYLFHTTIGRTMDIVWEGQLDPIHATRIYSAKAFTYGISIIPIGLFIAMVGFIALRRYSLRRELPS